jgi:hypothetical protein
MALKATLRAGWSHISLSFTVSTEIPRFTTFVTPVSAILVVIDLCLAFVFEWALVMAVAHAFADRAELVCVTSLWALHFTMSLLLAD